MDFEKKLIFSEKYKIRKEKNGAILFYKRDFSIMKTSDFVFDILKKIDMYNFSVNELIENYNMKLEKEKFTKFLIHLFKTNVICYKKDNYEKKYKQVYETINKKLTFQSPHFVWWDITSKCNLNCFYCYSAAGKSDPNELNLNEIKSILDQIQQMGIFYVYILGGEPFLKEGIFEILEYMNKLGLGIMITTNGTLINENVAQKLEEYDVSIVRVSVDSHVKDTHNSIRGNKKSYRYCISALENLSKVNIPNLGISTTLGPSNYKDIKGLIELGIKYNCNHIQVTPISSTGRAEETGIFLSENQHIELRKNLEILRNEYKKDFVIDAPEGVIRKECQIKVFDQKKTPDIMGCGAGKTCLSIYNDGNIGYCLLKRKSLGSLRKKSLESVWTEVNLKLASFKSPICEKCKNNKICFGPCPMLKNKCIKDRNEIIKSKLVKEVV